MRLKEKIDTELNLIRFSSDMENHVNTALHKKKSIFYSVPKVAVLLFTVFVLTGVTVVAAHIVLNIIRVNHDTLPELDPMYAVQIENIGEESYDSKDPFYDPNDPYDSYDYICNKLDIDLLDSELAVENPYMNVNVQTDKEDYCTLIVNNYILGDTSNYKLSYEYLGLYTCDPGKEYYSPIQLEVDIILSEEQEKSGLDRDYLGYYQFVEAYVSSQGYKVNIIRSTAENEEKLDADEIDLKSEKIAIFVVDGISYMLKGRTRLETMKIIVDSMK